MGSTTTAKKAPRLSQAELAEILGVDRTTIRNYQTAGMPYLPAGRGRSAEYIAPLSIHWSMGFRLSRQKKDGLPERARRLSGPVDPVAFQVALDQIMGDEVLVDALTDCYRECGDDDSAEALPVRAAYFRGMLEG